MAITQMEMERLEGLKNQMNNLLVDGEKTDAHFFLVGDEKEVGKKWPVDYFRFFEVMSLNLNSRLPHRSITIRAFQSVIIIHWPNLRVLPQLLIGIQIASDAIIWNSRFLTKFLANI